jgi:hypothetical protein
MHFQEAILSRGFPTSKKKFVTNLVHHQSSVIAHHFYVSHVVNVYTMKNVHCLFDIWGILFVPELIYCLRRARRLAASAQYRRLLPQSLVSASTTARQLG